MRAQLSEVAEQRRQLDASRDELQTLRDRFNEQMVRQFAQRARFV